MIVDDPSFRLFIDVAARLLDWKDEKEFETRYLDVVIHETHVVDNQLAFATTYNTIKLAANR